MAELKIKVGASVDRDLATAFRPVVEAARKAAQAADVEFKKAGRAIGTATKASVSQAEREYRRLEREATKLAKEQARNAEKARKEQVRATEQATKAEARAYAAATKEIDKWAKEGSKAAQKAKQDEARAFEKAEREKTRVAKEEEQARARAARAAQRDVEKRLAERKRAEQKTDAAYMRSASAAGPAAISAIGRIGGFAASKAAGLAMGVARGAGINTDLGSMFAQNSELETKAVELSNSGYMVGDKRNGSRVDPGQLMREALKIGSETGTDANDVIGGLQKFVGLTGDLKTGRDTMRDLLVLSKATGTNFEHMAAAAANVSNVLPDTDDKAAMVQKTMEAIAGQGKLGAVEIKDLASQMAKLAAGAGAFATDPAKGRTKATVVQELGVLAQSARGKGGAASATQAVNAVQSFVNTFDKGAREKAFKKFGVTTRDEKGQLLDSQTIIKSAITAAAAGGMGGFGNAMNQMFMDLNARKVTKGFENIYKEAGGGKAGLEAIDAEFTRLKNATMAQAEIQESFARSMKTGQSQAEVFNNQMRAAALQMQTALLPSIMALTPVIVEATKTFAGVVSWLTGDKQMGQIEGDAKRDVGNVRKSIETQLRGGNKISEATVEESRVATSEAFEAKSRAKAELVTAKENRMGSGEKAGLKVLDFLLAGGVTERVFGGKLGQSKIDTEEQDIRAKELKAQEMDKLYQEASSTNKELLSRIDRGLVVKVSNLNELPKPPGDGASNDGRQPSPEDRARQ